MQVPLVTNFDVRQWYSICLSLGFAGLWWAKFLVQQCCKSWIGVMFEGAYWDYGEIIRAMVQDIEFGVT